MKAKTLVALFGLSVTPSLAQAGELPTDWRGVRALGMGNAFTAVANDEDSQFSNPAGLARTRNPRSREGLHRIVLPGVELGGNRNGLGSLGGGGAQGNWLGNMAISAEKAGGESSLLEAQTFPSLIFGGKDAATILVGVPARVEARAYAPGTAAPGLVNLESHATVGLALGIAGGFRSGTISYGLSLRPNIRTSVVRNGLAASSLTSDQLKDELTGDAGRSTGVALDAGVLFTAADFWLPTFALSLRNLPTGCRPGYVNPINGRQQTMCGSLRSGTPVAGSNATLVDPTEVRAGFSLTPRFRTDVSRVNLKLSGDFFPLPITFQGNAYGVTDVPLRRLFHLGSELFFGSALIQEGFGLRAGLHDDAPTFGISLSIIGIALEYGTYVVDTGEKTATRKERRHLIGLTAGW